MKPFYDEFVAMAGKKANISVISGFGRLNTTRDLGFHASLLVCYTLSFSCVLKFICYFRVNFKFGLPHYVRYIRDSFIPGFLILEFCSVILL